MEGFGSVKPEEIIIVSGLSNAVTPNYISNAYSTFGKVKQVFIPKMPDGTMKPYCYVAFEHKATAQIILKKYQNFEIANLKLTNLPFNLEEFAKSDATADLVYNEPSDDELPENQDVFDPPFHDFTSAYLQRPDRADPINPIENDLSTLTQYIDMSKIEQFYNHGFVPDLQPDKALEQLLPKF